MPLQSWFWEQTVIIPFAALLPVGSLFPHPHFYAVFIKPTTLLWSPFLHRVTLYHALSSAELYPVHRDVCVHILIPSFLKYVCPKWDTHSRKGLAPAKQSGIMVFISYMWHTREWLNSILSAGLYSAPGLILTCILFLWYTGAQTNINHFGFLLILFFFLRQNILHLLLLNFTLSVLGYFSKLAWLFEF